MKAKFGALIVEGRGKIAGWVASRNRGGAYFRQKVTPVNPSTESQAVYRSRLATFAQGWRGLTASQRAAWNAAVTEFKKTDIFGDLKTPSGFNLYQALNQTRLILVQPALTLPPVPTAVSAIKSMSAVADVSDASVTLTYTPAIPATENVLVYATPPMSAGKSFAKSEYRLLVTLATADASPYAISAAYIARFGSVGSAGQKIFIKYVSVNTASGIRGVEASISTIVVA